MGGSSPKNRITQYFLSFHVGICMGPIDYISEIFFGDKSIFNWVTRETQTVQISKSDLFGGDSKEGGVSGLVDVLLGDSDQRLPAGAANRIVVDGVRLTPDTAPGYRGIASLFFRGVDSEGFYVGANNPYLKDVKVRLTRIPKSWYPEKATIGPGEGQDRKTALFYGVCNCRSDQEDENQRLTNKALYDGYVGLRTKIAEFRDDDNKVDLCTFIAEETHGFGYTEPNSPFLESHILSDVRMHLEYDVAALSVPNELDVMESAVAWFSEKTGYLRKILILPTAGYNTATDVPAYEAALSAARDTLTGMGVLIHAVTANNSSNGTAIAVDNTVGDNSPSFPRVSPGNFSAINTLGETYFGENNRDATVRDPSTYANANPAHIIHECLTNGAWGVGLSDTALDLDTFTYCADVLYSENFGLSFIWTKQMKVEELIGEVLDHINAVLYVSPSTGLISLRLIRAVDSADLSGKLRLNPGNCDIENLQRRGYGELVNEITVTWTDPTEEKEDTVTVQDMAGIQIQGGVISGSRNYYGVRNQALAYALAARDLASSSAPMMSCDAKVSRKAWAVVPGDIVVLEQFDVFGISEFPMRVLKVDYGRPGDSGIKLSLIEDIYARGTYAAPAQSATLWRDSSGQPRPAAFQSVMTLPHFFVVRDGGNTEYPIAYLSVLAACQEEDSLTGIVSAIVTDAAENTYWDDVGVWDFVMHAVLTSPLAAESTSAAPTYGSMTEGPLPKVGGFVVIGDDEATQEICLIASSWVWNRGCLDTTPKAWPVGTKIWIFKDESFSDATERAPGETATYKVRPTTSGGTLALSRASAVSGTASLRQHRPLRPANVVVAGSAWLPVDLLGEGLTEIVVTWANRNRELESDTPLRWSAATVAPETGQTTEIDVLSSWGDVLLSVTGITETTHTILPGDVPESPTITVQVWAARAGMRSLQAHSVDVILRSGYGSGYGIGYGG